LGAASHLQRADRERGPAPVGGLRGGMGSEVCTDRTALAEALGAGPPALRIPGADPEGDLHDERGGKPEYDVAQGDQDAWGLPERGCRAETALSGAKECGQEMATYSGLEGGTEPLHPALGRADRRGPGPRPIARQPPPLPGLRLPCYAQSTSPLKG